MPEPALALYLDGPMQAWGHQSRFNRRTTLAYPTRSGIIGLLAAALGIEREDRDSLATLADLRMEILSLRHPSRWIDYHTVGGGYDPKTQRMSIPRKANDDSPDTVLTDREYLADARFGVLLTGDRGLLERCEHALRNPRWGLWLGRKCCIPASPICQGCFSDRQAAKQHLESLAQDNRVVCSVVEVGQFDEGNDTLMDIPICFRPREFQPRRIRNEPGDG